MRYRRTLAEPAEISGKGLHTGEECSIRIFPADEGGVVFISQGEEISAAPENADASLRCTTLKGGKASVEVVEHLLGAFFIGGITDARVEVQGKEIPFLDGSSLPFVQTVKKSGTRDLGMVKKRFKTNFPLLVKKGISEILFIPWEKESLEITVVVSFPEEGLKCDFLTFEAYGEDMEKTIAPARTFAFESWIEDLRKRGLIGGGSLENAVVLGRDGKPVHGCSLRLKNEICAHKALDFIGDLMLFQEDLRGRIVAFYPGHAIHLDFVRELAKRKEENDAR